MNVDKFVSKALKLLEQERDAEVAEKSHLYEHTSTKELQRRGVCLVKLRIASQRSGLYGRTVLEFEQYWPGKQMPSHSITPGDILGLSLSQSDAVQDQLASGIVTRTSPTSISVAFEESHDTLALDDTPHYSLLKLANDVTYKRIKNALQNLSAYSSGPSTCLIQTLFGETEPGPPLSESWLGQDLQFFNPGLDDSQREAVKFALCQRELAIIHGPPGTGKTTTVVEIIRQAVKHKLKVLACAPSNIAVDNLVERLSASKTRVVRLGHPARLLPTIQPYSLDAILATSEETQIVQDVSKDIDQIMRKLRKLNDKGQREKLQRDLRHLRKELRQREGAAIKQVLKSAEVVLATLTGASASGPTKFLQEDHFDLVVIDECSQALEAACWISLVKAPRCILAGDHNQLPPTIISKTAAKEGLEVTLMERLLKLYEGDEVMRMLTVQYRMNEVIMRWASEQLYHGRLQAHESVAQHLLRDLESLCDNEVTSIPMLLIDTAGCNLQELNVPEEVSKGNEGEADLVTMHVQKLVDSGLGIQDIAVIAPYNLQVELLRLRLSERYPKLEIKSVDGFQGREKEAVVISLVRSNDRGEVGFLAEDRRINVAVTRARRHLAVICDSETVGRHAFLKSLVDYITEHGEVWSAEQYIGEGALETNYPRPEFVEEQIDQAVAAAAAAGSSNKPRPDTGQRHVTKQQTSRQKKTDQRKPETRAEKPDLKKAENRQTATVPDDDDDTQEELRAILVEFYINPDVTTHQFPASLSSRDRFLVHELAESLSLLHISQGEGQERHIVVSKPTKKITDNSSLNRTEYKGAAPVGRDNKQARTSEPHADPAEDKADLSKDKSDIAVCDKCGKSVPTTNIDLHTLRCQPPSVEPKVATGARPKSKKKKKPTAADGSTASKGEAEEDFDALIEEAMKENKSCHMKKCKASTAIMGQNCAFCAQRFCLSHHIPEVHGCGDAAKAKARAVISREGVLHRGSGIPSKLPDPTKKIHLQRKLDKKLNNMSESRKPKKKETNN